MPLGQPFELGAGASATLDSRLTITFDAVRSDSRCPIDAICIWAGDAVVAVSLSEPLGSRVERELHTDAGRSETSYAGYSIALVALAPFPRSDRQIGPKDYVATLTVRTR
ncbi:MAG: hypothetical protein LC804_07515 [Acidobacteria bacterium]|nr:hypothetical protein [Acidobacteriota bacterium]